MDTLAVVGVELVTFLFTGRGQRCCQPWSPDTAIRCSLYLSGKPRKGMSPKTQGKPPSRQTASSAQVQQCVEQKSGDRLRVLGSSCCTSGDIPQWLAFIYPAKLCWADALSSLHHPAHKVSQHHTWEPLSKTTIFYCWPLSSSTGALVGWVFCSRVLLTVSVERRVNYAFSLPVPRVFQADWGFKPVEPSRHKPVCVCFQATVGVLYHLSLVDWQGWWPMPVIHRLLCQVLRLLAFRICASALFFFFWNRHGCFPFLKKMNVHSETLCAHVVSSLCTDRLIQDSIILSYAHRTSCTVKWNTAVLTILKYTQVK